MRQFTAQLLLPGVAFALCFTASANADVIASNILPGETYRSGSFVTGTQKKAFLFTVGAAPIQFGSLDVVLGTTSINPTGSATGGIYTVDNDAPDGLLASFGTVTTTSSTPSEFSLTTASPFTLQANTQYAFLLENVAGQNDANWASANAPNNTLPTLTDPSLGSFDGYRFTNNAGATWRSSGILNKFRLNSASTAAAAVPEPGTAVALSAFLGGLLLRRRREQSAEAV